MSIWTLRMRFCLDTGQPTRATATGLTLVEESRMNTVVVSTADCKVSGDADTTLVTYGLGSCIALVVHDPTTTISGMLHFMLPDSTIDKAKAEANPYMFADTGIPRLINAVCERGAKRGD